MTTLAAQHPMQLVLGSVVVAEELATKGRQLTLAQICGDAVDWAVETRDLLREIACDAADGVLCVRSVAADGVITSDEAELLVGRFSEIEREAITGKIL